MANNNHPVKSCQVRTNLKNKIPIENIPSCQNFKCPYNLFYEPLKYTPRETDLSRACLNCGLLLQDYECSTTELAELYGVSRQRIEQMTTRALAKLAKRMLEAFGDDLSTAQRTFAQHLIKRNEFRFFKYRRYYYRTINPLIKRRRNAQRIAQ